MCNMVPDASGIKARKIVGNVETVETPEVDYEIYPITDETTVMVVKEKVSKKGEVWLFSQEKRHLLAEGVFYESSMENDIVYVDFSGELIVEEESPYVGYRTH